MTVSITDIPGGAAISWNRADDPRGYIAQAVQSGRLEHALTALGLKEFDDLADVDQSERADILRATAALANELTRRVRAMTVIARDEGMTWGTLASILTDDVHARSSARATYDAGLRQLGRPVGN